MNLIEQYLAESQEDHHDDAVGRLKDHSGGANVRDYHKHGSKDTGAHPVSQAHMTKMHHNLVGAGYTHKSNSKGDVHVYKKGKTTVTHYHGDNDVNISTRK